MRIKEYLNIVCEQIKYKPIRDEISTEIENHIKEAKESYIEEGIEEKQAEQKAIEQMGDAKEIGRKLNKIHRPKFDWKLVLIIAIVLAFGGLVAFTRSEYSATKNVITEYIIYLMIGLVSSIAIYFIDYRKMLKYSNYIYIIATAVTLCAIFYCKYKFGIVYLYYLRGTIFAHTVGIVMPLYVIAFVGFIQKEGKENRIKIELSEAIKVNINTNILKIIILSIISVILLMILNSLTPACILMLVYFIIATAKILQLKSKKMKYISMLWGIPIILGILGILMIYMYTGGAFRINRFISSFRPELDPKGSGWTGMNQKLVISSAQLFGEAENRSEAIDLFDEGTNYAFISILAHYGWIISIGMVLAIIALNVKLIIDAIKVKDEYGKLLIIGIGSIFILQSIFNLLMNLNLGIKADFSIPLISYGKVDLIINMISLAFVLAVYRRKDIVWIDRNKQTVQN